MLCVGSNPIGSTINNNLKLKKNKMKRPDKELHKLRKEAKQFERKTTKVLVEKQLEIEEPFRKKHKR